MWLAWASLRALDASADGPAGYGTQLKQMEVEYRREALEDYGRGYALIESANRLDQDAAAATNQRTRLQASHEASEKYEDALHAFGAAVQREPGMYEAHTYLGYANRKLGRHEASLAAYSTALRLKPDYVQAIEYQGEAYLGLNLFDRARFDYLRLYALDAAQAQKLLEAMQTWLTSRAHATPGPINASLATAADWIAARQRERKPIPPQTDGW